MTKKINKILLFLSSATILVAPMLATISCSSTSDNQNEENTNPDGNTKPDGDNNGSNENNNSSDKPTIQKPLINVDHYTVRGKTFDGKTMWDSILPTFLFPFKEFPRYGNNGDNYTNENGNFIKDYKYRVVDENGNPIAYRISINAIELPALEVSYNGQTFTTEQLSYNDDESTTSEKIFFDVIFAEGKNYDGSSRGLRIMPPDGSDSFLPIGGHTGVDKVTVGGPFFYSDISSGNFIGLDTNNKAVNCCFAFYVDEGNGFHIDPFINKRTKEGIGFDGFFDEINKNKPASFTYSIKVAPK